MIFRIINYLCDLDINLMEPFNWVNNWVFQAKYLLTGPPFYTKWTLLILQNYKSQKILIHFFFYLKKSRLGEAVILWTPLFFFNFTTVLISKLCAVMPRFSKFAGQALLLFLSHSNAVANIENVSTHETFKNCEMASFCLLCLSTIGRYVV